MRIYLVRHGESLGNVDRNVHVTMPDNTIRLTLRGKLQAYRTGMWLCDQLPRRRWYHRVGGRDPRTRIWTSPYERTRSTAFNIVKGISDVARCRSWCDGTSYVRDVREHVLLCEQQFGLFDGLEDERLRSMFPNEHAHYDKHERSSSRFWARMPLGESRFDVATRVHQSFGTFQRDADRHGIDTLVIVSHGVTIRAFVMMWCHRTPEWFDIVTNPPNGSVWMIDGDDDRGIVFEPSIDPDIIDRHQVEHTAINGNADEH